MIEIKNDFYSIGILPQIGGSLSFFKYNGFDIMRPCSDMEKEPNQTAMFPMIPYTSFIQNGHFPYFGITRNVTKNSAINRFPIHGDVWTAQLDIQKQTPSSLSLSYTHNKSSGFPFCYTAQITYELKESEFIVRLEIQNDSNLPMPFGMGLHPFFIRQSDTQIEFEAPLIWYRGDDPILGHPYSAPENLRFSSSYLVPKNGVDISFGQWNRYAKITYPSKNIFLEIRAGNPFRYLTLYAPKGKDFFCLEPVTHTPDAFNLASQGIVGTGIQSLAPHQKVSEEVSFSVKGLK